jgi:hypothetical protein
MCQQTPVSAVALRRISISEHCGGMPRVFGVEQEQVVEATTSGGRRWY